MSKIEVNKSKYKLPNEQIERIMSKYNPKFKQQKTNLKFKLNNSIYSTALTKLLIEEIIHLNEQIKFHNKLMNVNDLINTLSKNTRVMDDIENQPEYELI